MKQFFLLSQLFIWVGIVVIKLTILERRIQVIQENTTPRR